MDDRANWQDKGGNMRGKRARGREGRTRKEREKAGKGATLWLSSREGRVEEDEYKERTKERRNGKTLLVIISSQSKKCFTASEWLPWRTQGPNQLLMYAGTAGNKSSCCRIPKSQRE